jgi:hypothetical protein
MAFPFGASCPPSADNADIIAALCEYYHQKPVFIRCTYDYKSFFFRGIEQRHVHSPQQQTHFAGTQNNRPRPQAARHVHSVYPTFAASCKPELAFFLHSTIA